MTRVNNWPRGPMDKAPDYESGDSRFESWRGHIFFSLRLIIGPLPHHVFISQQFFSHMFCYRVCLSLAIKPLTLQSANQIQTQPKEFGLCMFSQCKIFDSPSFEQLLQDAKRMFADINPNSHSKAAMQFEAIKHPIHRKWSNRLCIGQLCEFIAMNYSLAS